MLEGGGQLPPPASLPLHCPQSDVFMSLMGFGCGMDFDSDKAYRQGLGVGAYIGSPCAAAEVEVCMRNRGLWPFLVF